MRKGVTLSQLSDMIHKKIGTVGQDIECDYHPHVSEMRNTTKLCIIVLLSRKEELCARPDTAKKFHQELFDTAFFQLVEFIADDIDKHEYISFYHYLGLLTALSFHYADCIAKKKNQTIDLSDPTGWENPSFDMVVLTLFFVAGTLFKKPLEEQVEDLILFINCSPLY